MSRYIDADALIENIKRVYCTDCNNYNEVRCRACGTDDAMAMIEDAPTADVAPRTEWISVEERVPDKNGVYIVALTESEYENLLYFDVQQYAYGEWCNIPKKLTVTHWMPLPEPPKGDRHEM